MKIIPLSEGSFTIDKTKQFIPFDQLRDDLQQRNTGSLLVEVQPFVVITTEDVLLLDTGLGFNVEGKLQLHQNLIEAGINPSEITKVLMSHLHKDHSGGVTKEVNGVRELAFPQATYFVQQQELDFAMQKGNPSYFPEMLQALQSSDNVTMLNGNGVIDGYISYEVTGAHSPFHQVFRIVDAGETVFFGADDAPQLQQMNHRFVAKYDYDGKKASELRQVWKERGAAEGWTFLFYHDIKTPTHRFS
jgi:glyoxylase-like metal-dependent hydrolase (beta-lactamase superfamily II)